MEGSWKSHLCYQIACLQIQAPSLSSCVILDKLLLPRLQIGHRNNTRLKEFVWGRKEERGREGGREEGTFAELNAKKKKLKTHAKGFLKNINTFMNLAKNQVKNSIDFRSADNGAILKSSVVSILVLSTQLHKD